VHLEGQRRKNGKEREEIGVLDGSGDGDGEECDFRIIAFRVPSPGFFEGVTRSCYASVLTEASCDYDGRSVDEEAVLLPVLRGVVDPLVEALHDAGVEIFELLEVKSDLFVQPRRT
jgi:hypothetical protein